MFLVLLLSTLYNSKLHVVSRSSCDDLITMSSHTLTVVLLLSTLFLFPFWTCYSYFQWWFYSHHKSHSVIRPSTGDLIPIVNKTLSSVLLLETLFRFKVILFSSCFYYLPYSDIKLLWYYFYFHWRPYINTKSYSVLCISTNVFITIQRETL